MSLADDIAAEQRSSGNNDKTDAWLATLPKKDRDTVLAAAIDPNTSDRALFRAVRKHGYPAAEGTFRNWCSRQRTQADG